MGERRDPSAFSGQNHKTPVKLPDRTGLQHHTGQLDRFSHKSFLL